MPAAVFFIEGSFSCKTEVFFALGAALPRGVVPAFVDEQQLEKLSMIADPKANKLAKRFMTTVRGDGGGTERGQKDFPSRWLGHSKNAV